MKRLTMIVLGTALLVTACGQGEHVGTIVASGHVEATEVLISTKVAGTLEHLAVDEGTIVEAGQEIAQIDTVDELLALESAKADRALAQAPAIRVLGVPTQYIPHGKADAILARLGLDGAGVAASTRELLDSL